VKVRKKHLFKVRSAGFPEHRHIVKTAQSPNLFHSKNNFSRRNFSSARSVYTSERGKAATSCPMRSRIIQREENENRNYKDRKASAAVRGCRRCSGGLFWTRRRRRPQGSTKTDSEQNGRSAGPGRSTDHYRRLRFQAGGNNRVTRHQSY